MKNYLFLIVNIPYVFSLTKNLALNKSVTSSKAENMVGGLASNTVDGIVSACSSNIPSSSCYGDEEECYFASDLNSENYLMIDFATEETVNTTIFFS